jgi:predicted outer membrane repeat protein
VYIHTYIHHKYIHTYCVGAIYVEDASILASGTVQFIHNSAVAAGGALTGSPQSNINITSESVAFLDNTAGMVSCMCMQSAYVCM